MHEKMKRTCGEKLRIARYEKGLSQQKLAALAGVHWHTVNRLERYDAIPTARTAKAIREALGVTADDIWSVDDLMSRHGGAK